MRLAIIDNTNQIINIVEAAHIDDVPNSKWLSDTSPLQIGEQYTQELAEMGQTDSAYPTLVRITSAKGCLKGVNTPKNQYTCKQNKKIKLVGSVSLPNQSLQIPFVRSDTGREIPVMAVVKNNVITITVTFPTAGYWQCNNELINRMFAQPKLSIDTQTFTVI